MSSGFIRHLLQSIKKKKDGVAVLPLCIVVIGFLMLLSNFMYRRQLVQINYENIDTALTDSLLAGAIINYSEFGRTGKVIKNARHKLRVVVHQHIILVIGMHLFGVLDRLIHAAVPEQSAVAVD